MRRAKILLLFLIQTFVYSYDINLDGEAPLSGCISNGAENTFLCKGSNGDEFFVKETGWEYVAFKRSKDGKYEPKEVYEIYDNGGETVYVKNVTRADLMAPMPSVGYYYKGDMANFAHGLSDIHRRLFTYEEEENKVTETDKEIFDFVESVKKEYEQRRKHFDAQMNSSRLKVELESGESLTCRRDLKSVNCSLLDCGKDEKGNKVLLLKDRYGQSSYFESFSFNQSGISKTGSRIKGIYGANGQALLERNGELFQELTFKPNMLVPGRYNKNPELFAGLTNFSSANMLMSEFDMCSPKMGDLMDKTISEAHDDLKNAEMVQLIELTNGMIESNFINLESLPGHACVQNGVYYSPESYQKLKEIGRSSRKTISMKKAQEIFDKARARNDIAWDYTFDGCYARAHLMARMFEEEGIHVDKAWLRGTLQIPGEDMTKTWGYHVAPVVYVEDEKGKVQEMIIDPSVSQKPLTPKEWSALMEVDFDDSQRVAYPTPTNTAVFGKTSYAVTSSEPYWPDLDTRLTEEMKMRMAADTMERYKTGMDPWGQEWMQWEEM